mgnify:CR=1 FL=1
MTGVQTCALPILDTPGTPILSTNPLDDGTVASFHVVSTTLTIGSTMYMDFNYGTTTNTATHRLYKTVQTSDGAPFGQTQSVSIDVADLPPATYYWSVTARTETTGARSGCSSSYVWSGPNVTQYNHSNGKGGLDYNQINSSVGGISRSISGVNWSIPNNSTGSALPPVAVSPTTVNVPVTVPASPTAFVWPPYTGNSDASSGTGGNKFYAVGSTGPYTPKDAWTLLVASGDDNWYAVISDSWPVNTFYSYETGNYNQGIVLAADSPAVVQIIIGIMYNGYPYYQIGRAHV